MKPDNDLRRIVSLIRRVNADVNMTDAAARRELDASARGYRCSRCALDADAAIKELLDFGSTDEPREVSVELRHALARFLAGKIQKKRGPKLAPPDTLRVHFAAHNARVYMAGGTKKREAIRAASAEAGVTQSAVDAHLYPRKRRNKLA